MGKSITITLLLLTVAFATQQETTRLGKSPNDKIEKQTNNGTPTRKENLSGNDADILIGYFGPNEASHPNGGDMWCAASLAIEHANKAGGYRGRPFRLLARWSENPWGSGVKHVTRMAYKHNVCAVIGGIDGPSTHLAEQVAAKALFPLLSAVSTDRTANLANVPWMFSCLPGDHLQAPALTKAIASLAGSERFLVISAVDHDSHLLAVELTKCFRREHLAPSYHFEFKPNETDINKLVETALDANVKAMVIIASMRDSVRLTACVREGGFEGIIFGGPCMGRRGFTEQAGNAAEGVIFPMLYTSSEKANGFNRQFFERFGREPDYLAAHTYDTVRMLIDAIGLAGLDRECIRDTIQRLSPWCGVTGTICWDTQGSNSRAVGLGTISKGRVQPLSVRNRAISRQTSSSNCLP